MKQGDTRTTAFIEFISVRFGGRPLCGYIWMLWLGGILTTIFSYQANAEGPIQTRSKSLAVITAVSLAVFLVRLVFLLANSTGREWLVSKYGNEAMEQVSRESLIFVRIVPLIGLLVLVEFILFM